MFLNIRYIKKGAFIGSLLFLLLACNTEVSNSQLTEGESKTLESVYLADLNHCISLMEKMQDLNSIEDLQKSFIPARNAFKQIEPLLAFKDAENYQSLNAPNILKIEEEDLTDVKIKKPLGFQVLEEDLYSDEVNIEDIQSNLVSIKGRLNLILKNTTLIKFKPYHFLWMLRDEVNRVSLTGITGFDSPVLSRSVEEGALVYGKLKEYLKIYKSNFKNDKIYQEWMTEMDETIQDLKGDFDTFDRYGFIKKHIKRQYELWNRTVTDWEVDFPFTLAIENDAKSLFSNKTFNVNYFSDVNYKALKPELITLGRALFNDPRLSASGNMSCATCHEEKMAFTDGLTLSLNQKRNSPTLNYAHLQNSFFYDNRSGSLEGQIVSVINSETEFHTTAEKLFANVKKEQAYSEAFDSLFSEGVTDVNIRRAIATYIRSLAPFDSKFDRNIRGEENTLTSLEVEGFNIFMGKGSCATCHFPPVFNGTVPPRYEESEMELIGTPQTSENLQVDDDLGRYEIFKTEERKFFFKTPTVRNIALTAPYMHNGVYDSLEQVMDFYNNGGGAGMGFDLPGQTLPSDSLNLSDKEQQAVIAFMRTLTDKKLE